MAAKLCAIVFSSLMALVLVTDGTHELLEAKDVAVVDCPNRGASREWYFAVSEMRDLNVDPLGQPGQEHVEIKAA